MAIHDVARNDILALFALQDPKGPGRAWYGLAAAKACTEHLHRQEQYRWSLTMIMSCLLTDVRNNDLISPLDPWPLNDLGEEIKRKGMQIASLHSLQD